jgi:cyclopropane-fatty-acyl-phospholipid synthase
MARGEAPPAPLATLAATLARVGANLTVVAPGIEPLAIGDRPEKARVTFHRADVLRPLITGDHLALAEAYLDGGIDVDGDLGEVVKLTDLLDMDVPWPMRAAFWLRLRLPDRRRYQRAAIAFHYDRPPEFFLGWLDRWRSYSHGFYADPAEGATAAQARKLQFAIDALGLRPGMEVLDMGAGWGCFVEYAGLQGIRVHGITISAAQHAFVARLIEDQRLPCTIELVDFLDYRPRVHLDGAVFMGTLEHMPSYRRVAAFLAEHLRPEARVYADFCAQRRDVAFGAFMRRYIWPAPTTYVNVQKLVRALVRAGFNIHELRDDTTSYAWTVRDWADGLEADRAELARRWGEPAVRAFLLFLRGSQHFLATNRTQAYHLVAGRTPAPLRRG